RAGQGAQLGAALGRPERRADRAAVLPAEGAGVPTRPMSTTVRAEVPIEELEIGAYTIPTDEPEADGTLAWDSTTIVVVHAHGGGEWGLGYTYADVSTAKLVESKLAGIVCGRDAMAPQAAWEKMVE